MRLRGAWRRTAAVSSGAFAASTLAVFFLVDHARAAGAVLVAVIVGLAVFLTIGPAARHSRAPRSLGALLRGSGLAIGVGLAGFALGLILVTLSRSCT